MRRLTILLATVGVLLLIPATQAFAGTLKVNIEGSGSGEVSSVEGLGFVDPEFAGLYEGSPPMECSYNAETEATSGVCENTLTNEEGFETETVHAVADFGSEFAGWIVEKGGLFNSYCEASEGETGYEACAPAGLEGEPNEFEVTAVFVHVGTLKVNIEGSGSGEVSSVEGLGFVDPEFAGLYEGSPPMECSYNAETEATSGVCENTLTNEEGFETETVHAVATFGSEFAGWIVEKGGLFNSYCEASEGETGYEACAPAGLEGEPNEFEVTAVFSECQEGSKAPTCPEEPSGPTNLRTLTVTKSPSPAAGTGAGSVSSKPKGIKCGPACSEAVASMYKATPVLLKAKPTTTSTFVEWTGACAGVEGLECTIPMAEDEEVGAVFTGTSKALEPAEALTVDKGESTGQGTVKGTGGLGCEAQCTSTTVLYQGPVTEPKPKPGKTVTLKQAPAFGSAFIGWVGCDSEVEGNCVVTMETAKTVSAEYEALPNKVLTVNKAYSSGNGSVSSKPKGVKCGPACTQAVANMPEGAEIALKEKPGSETTFVEWENAIEGGDCDGSTAEICVVGMDKDETIKAVFSKTSKVLKEESEATLTVSKGEGTGFGTVKGTGGLGCEFLCTSTSVVYQGPISLPKPKPGKTVKLKAISAPGSAAVEWSGCTGFEEEGAICLVEMSESKEVVATFNELE